MAIPAVSRPDARDRASMAWRLMATQPTLRQRQLRHPVAHLAKPLSGPYPRPGQCRIRCPAAMRVMAYPRRGCGGRGFDFGRNVLISPNFAVMTSFHP